MYTGFLGLFILSGADSDMVVEMFWRVRAWLASFGLQRRFQALMLIVLLATLAFFWWIGQRAIEDSTQLTLDHQLTAANVVASSLDQHLGRALARLEMISAQLGSSPAEPVRQRATQLWLSAYGQRLLWLDTEGYILWSEPFDATLLAQPFPDFPSVRSVLDEGRPAVSGLAQAMDPASPYILLTVPARSPAGEINGLLVEKVGLNRLGLGRIVDRTVPAGTAYIEVVDHDGTVLTSTSSERTLTKGDHTDQFAKLINDQRALVDECHQCHTGPGGDVVGRIDEVLAFAPLDAVSWGVAVRQPAAEVLAPAKQLRQTLLLGGGGLLVVVLLVTAWFVRRQVAGPIQALDEASAQLAAGNLGVPIRKRGIDEVARLTDNLEQMRVKLETTLEDHRRWNKTLEMMVEERTRELTTLYEQLEGKAAVCKQLLGKVLTAQEEERTRLARELHDTIGQSLTAIIMTTASVEKYYPMSAPRGKEKLTRVRGIAAQALQDLRSVISNLRPEALDDLGLVLALRSQAKEHLEPVGVRVRLKATGLEERLPPEVEIVIFRVVQEAITNIARHARASEAHILLTKKHSRLIVRVEDDGLGFDSEGALDGYRQAWGLRGMEERITLLGGKLYVSSQPGGGTLLMAEVPLDTDQG
jgi:signal transduction histidine kinase